MLLHLDHLYIPVESCQLTGNSAAQVDLAQYAALMIEEHLLFAKDVYEQRKLKIGYDLKHGIEGLTAAMEYFSIQGHSESFPLSVSVLLPRVPFNP